MATMSEKLREPYGYSENEASGEITPLVSQRQTEAADLMDEMAKALEENRRTMLSPRAAYEPAIKQIDAILSRFREAG